MSATLVSVTAGIERANVVRKEKKRRRDSVSMVGPYARIRVVAAILILLLALIFIGFRTILG